MNDPILTTLDLLSQEANTLLRDRNSKLKLILLVRTVYHESIEAIGAFIEKKYYLFDAQVGETSCQIRAYKILLLSINIGFQNSLKNSLKIIIDMEQKIRDLLAFFEKNLILNKGKYNKYLDKSVKISEFFDEENILIKLCPDIKFIIESYLLEKYSLKSKENIPIAIDYKKLCLSFNVSKAQAKRFIHNTQKSLSEASCGFILQLIKLHGAEPKMQLIMPYLLRIAEEQRQVLPCYFITKAILNHAIYDKKLILLISNRYINEKLYDTIFMLFAKDKNNTFLEITPKYSKAILENACIVIKGDTIYTSNSKIESVSSFKKKIDKIGLMNIVLFNMAKHPQYIGEKLKALSENPFRFIEKDLSKESLIIIQNSEKELFDKQKLAEYYGCCNTNPKLFLIKHIFCDLVKNQLHRFLLSNNKEYVKTYKIMEFNAIL